MTRAFNIETILTNKGKPGLDLEQTMLQKQLFYGDVQRKVLMSGVKGTWNIKSFLMENLTTILGLMMRERFRDTN